MVRLVATLPAKDSRRLYGRGQVDVMKTIHEYSVFWCE